MILYGDKVQYKDKVGIVKHVQGSFAHILFENSKKNVILPTDALEKLND